MSFFISSIPAGALMSSPPVSKHTPLPTSVTRGAPGRANRKSIKRGERGLPRPTAAINGNCCSSTAPLADIDGAALLGCQVGRDTGQFLRPHVVGWCVDQVARQLLRCDGRRQPGAIRAGRRLQARATRRGQ